MEHKWRTLWFEYVRKIKRKKKCTHKEAMSLASVSWPQEKEKLKRKFAREQRKRERDAKKTQENLAN